MKIERTKNATRNIIWGFIEKITSLILPFCTRTVLIKTLGTDYLGLNSLFTSILSVLSISELGIGTAIVFSMYKPIAEDDTKTLCALLNVYKKIYHIIGTIILIVGLILTPFIPYLIKANTCPENINIYVLYLIYLFNTSISYFLYAYKVALFSAYQRNDLTSKRNSLISFFSNILQILILILFHDYYAYVIIIPIATILTNIINAILANKMFPNIVCSGTISNEIKQSIKKRVIGLLSFKIYGVIFSSVDSIVISSFLGLTPLASYNSYYYVQTAIIGFLTIITNSITAGVGNKMVTNSKEDNYRDFKNIVFVNGWICSWCAVCLFCLYQHFIQWWVGKELLFSLDTMILMVLYFLLPRITTITFTYREAAGLWWEDRFRPLIATVVNLVTNFTLVQLIGMNGVIISTLICTIFINIPWGTIILFKHYFERSPIEYFKNILLYIVITFIVGTITFFICGLLPSTGFLIMIIKAVICVIFPNMLFWMIYHKFNEYQFMKKFVLKTLSKLKYKQ